MKKYEKYKESDSKWIGIIPENWETNKIAEIYSERNEKVSDRDYAPLSVTMKGILPQLENVAKTNNGDDRKLVLGNDFVINSRADRRGACGISAYDGSVSLINTVLKPLKKTNNLYFSFVFYSTNFSDEFFRWGNGIHNDLWSTKWSKMKNILVPIPSVKEQDSIARFLDNSTSSIDNLIADKQRLIEKLKEYRQAIINEAVTKGLDKNALMKDSGVDWIGKIPEDWRITTIGNLYSIQLGKMLQKTQREDSDVYRNYICAQNVGDGIIKTDNIKKMWFSQKELSNYKVESGDLIVVEGGNVGLCSFFRGEIQECYIQNAVHRVRSTTSSVAFLRYWLNYIKLNGYIDLICNKATIAHYTKEKFTNSVFIAPSKEQQEQIVAFLDKKTSGIETTINNINVQIIKLREYKKSLISEAVTGKIKIEEHIGEGVI